MTILLSGLLALVGVGLGGLLSSLTQDRAYRREQLRLSQDTQRAACGRLVAAVRQYRTYVAGPDAQTQVWPHPDGVRLVPGIGAEGARYQEAMEAAFTEVQLVAEDQETINRAHFLTSIARRVAVAAAVYGSGRVPSDLDEQLFTAERDFVNRVRQGLALPGIGPIPFEQDLIDVDAELSRAYGSGQRQSSATTDAQTERGAQ